MTLGLFDHRLVTNVIRSEFFFVISYHIMIRTLMIDFFSATMTLE